MSELHEKDSLGSHVQVAKNPRTQKLKDKLRLVGVIGVCVVVGVCSLWPKHRASLQGVPDEKQDTTSALNQNLELIAKLKENRQQRRYHGSLLKMPHISTVSKETLARMNAPSTFFSTGEAHASVKTGGKTLFGHDDNADFLNQQNDIASVSAKQLPHPTLTVPAGEMIPATLETAVNSELVGMVRAITTRDVYALSGNKMLIPKGATLVGQFNTSVTQGQNRIFVVWDRVQMTNGVIVTLNSPSADAIGRSGQAADTIDRHFFERFGSGVLLSVLGATTATSGVNGQTEYNSMAQYRMNMAGGFQQAANQTLQQDMQTKPTLTVNQGAQINVFVAHDLDFYRVARRI